MHSLKAEVILVIDRACCGTKKKSHAKSCVHKVCQKSQTKNFYCFHNANVKMSVIPNTLHRKNDVAEEDALSLCQLCLEFTDDDNDYFNDCVHCATSICKV